MILILADGSEFNCMDTSFDSELYVQTDLANVSTAFKKINNQNLKRAELGGTIIIDGKVIDSTSFKVSDDGEVILTYILRDKSEMETVQERLDEQDAALMELAELIGG